MLKRTLVFSNPICLSLKNNQLVFFYKDCPDESQSIPIEDIGMVMIDNQCIDITIPLLNALAENNVSVVLCDNKRMPCSLLTGLNSNNLQGEILRSQITAGEVLKKQLWRQVVVAKIRNQSILLKKTGHNCDLLKSYYTNVKSGDIDNREGIAARLYFHELFGDHFIRDRDAEGINSLLNYGYGILRSSVTRALISSGLFPGIGLFHHHRGNAFPLADDIMEPYRPFVDEIVYDCILKGRTELTKDTKAELINLQYCDTRFERVVRPLSVGLSITTSSLVKCYRKEKTELSFPML